MNEEVEDRHLHGNGCNGGWGGDFVVRGTDCQGSGFVERQLCGEVPAPAPKTDPGSLEISPPPFCGQLSCFREILALPRSFPATSIQPGCCRDDNKDSSPFRRGRILGQVPSCSVGMAMGGFPTRTRMVAQKALEGNSCQTTRLARRRPA